MNSVKQEFESDILQNKLLSLPIVKKYKEKSVSHNQTSYEIELGNGIKTTIEVYHLKDLYPSTLLALIDKLNKDTINVVVGPYISERGSELCKENHLNYFDVCGNSYFSSSSIYISEKGNKNTQVEHKESKNLFSNHSFVSSKIIRRILEDVNKVWKIKYLSKELGCSIGQVSKVMNKLIQNGYVSKTDDGYKLIDSKGLLDDWSEEYSNHDSISIKCYSLDKITKIEEELRKLNKKGIKTYLTGFSGGVRYAPVVNYNKVHFYASKKDIKKIEEQLDLKEVDSGENVVIMIADEAVTMDSREIKNDTVVSPVQAYLDLKKLKGRGEEMAEEIYRKVIANGLIRKAPNKY